MRSLTVLRFVSSAQICLLEARHIHQHLDVPEMAHTSVFQTELIAVPIKSSHCPSSYVLCISNTLSAYVRSLIPPCHILWIQLCPASQFIC